MNSTDNYWYRPEGRIESTRGRATHVCAADENLGVVDVQAREEYGVNIGSHSDRLRLNSSLVRALKDGSLEVRRSNNGQLGEGLERQRRGSGGKSRHELCGKGEDLVEVEGGVERRGERLPVEDAADPGSVPGLDGEDGARRRDVGLVCDDGRGAEVGRHTNSLEDCSEAEERLGISHREGEGWLRDGAGSKGRLEELHVGLWLGCQFLSITYEFKPRRRKPSRCEDWGRDRPSHPRRWSGGYCRTWHRPRQRTGRSLPR